MKPDERGSLIVAMAVIMIVVMISVWFTARTVGNIHAVTHLQNFSAALGDADAGISDATYRIDNGQTTSFEVCPGCAGGSGVPGAPGVIYRADVDSTGDNWTIEAIGTDHGMPHAVQTRYTRSPKFPFALFGNTGLNFQGSGGPGGIGCIAGCGNATQSFGSYDSATDSGPTNGPVNIGSNGVVNCNGTLPSNVTVVYFNGGGGVSGCTNSTLVPLPTRYNLPMYYPPSSVLPCPGVFSTATQQFQVGTPVGIGSIAAGVYECTSPLAIVGNLTVTGPVQIYIDLPTSLNLSTTPDLVIATGACVNGPTDSSGNILCPSSPAVYPTASNLQIYSNGFGPIGGTTGPGYTFGGVIYAPGAYLTADGCKATYYGAVIANTLTCNGTPNLAVWYDKELGNAKTNWLLSSYSEIGSNQVTIP